MNAKATTPYITRYARNLAKRHGLKVSAVVSIVDDLGFSVYRQHDQPRNEWIIDEPRDVLARLDLHLSEIA